MDSSQIQAAIKELQDAVAHMEARKTDRLVRQEKEIQELSLSRARVDQLVLRLRCSACEKNPPCFNAARSRT
jgi:hypothetical protein